MLEDNKHLGWTVVFVYLNIDLNKLRSTHIEKEYFPIIISRKIPLLFDTLIL